MEIDVNKENVCINKLVCEKKEIFFVEEDMIVPDSKPDILNAINLSGNVCIYRKEVDDGKVKIEGCVNTYIMYLPDSENDYLRGLNACIDFSETIQISECKDGMDTHVEICIKDLECKVINGRKINVRAGLEAKIKIYSNEDVEIVNGLNNCEDIQTLENKLSINSLIGKESTKVYVKDTLTIDEKDEIAEILKVDVNLENQDLKISYNKVLSKCEVAIKIMYLTEDGRIGSIDGRIPAVGFIDMQNVSEENICDVNNEICNILVRPNNSEEHSIYVEIELESSCIVYDKKEITLIQDLYSPTVNLEFSQKRITTVTDKLDKVKDFTVTTKTNIPELIDGTLIDSEVNSIINKKQITDSKIICEGELNINFVFANSNNRINSKISKVPFEFWIENPMQDDNVNSDVKVNIISKKIDVKQNGDVDCMIGMEGIAEFSKNESINIIDNIETMENENDNDSGDYDSLILYIVQKGDTLWKIAKKFKSTIQDIARVNGIEDPDRISIGQKIYIPKFRCYNRRNNVNAISA